jgi:hypothetical protein
VPLLVAAIGGRCSQECLRNRWLNTAGVVIALQGSPWQSVGSARALRIRLGQKWFKLPIVHSLSTVFQVLCVLKTPAVRAWCYHLVCNTVIQS